MERRLAALYARAAPFVWSGLLAGLAGVALLHPAAPVAWSGAGLFVLLAIGSVARGLAVLRGGLEVVRRPPLRAVRGPTLLGVYVLFPTWLAAMAYTAPCAFAL